MAFVKRAERFSATAARIASVEPAGLKPSATETKPAYAGYNHMRANKKTSAPDRDEGLLRGSTQL